jgi:Holliday junction resolvase
MNRRELAVARSLRAEGWHVIRNGWPDFLCVRGLEVKAVEVKSRADRLSIAQKRAHKALRVAGIETETAVEEFGMKGRTISVRNIPSDLWLKLKMAAIKENKSVSAYLVGLITKAVNGAQK